MTNRASPEPTQNGVTVPPASPAVSLGLSYFLLAVLLVAGGLLGLPALQSRWAERPWVSPVVGVATPLTGRPGDLAVGLGAVWLVAADVPDTAVISRLDSRSSEPVGSLPINVSVPSIWGLVVDDESLWIGMGVFLRRLDLRSGDVLSNFQISTGATALAVDRLGVWVSYPNTVQRLDSTSGRLVTSWTIQATAALAIGPEAVWVIGRNGLVRIDPQADRIVANVPLGVSPALIAVGPDAVWVVDSGADLVYRIDPATTRVVAVIPVPRRPSALAVSVEAVWVAHQSGSSVSRIDPHQNQVVASLEVGPGPSSLALGPDALWVSHQNGLTRLDPRTEARLADLPLAGARLVSADQSAVWVLHQSPEQIARFNSSDGTAAGSLPVDLLPTALAVGPDAIWAALPSVADRTTPANPQLSRPASVVRLDPRTGRVQARVWGSATIADLAVTADAVWFGQRGGVSRIDPGQNQIVSTVWLGMGTIALAADGDALWVLHGEATPLPPRTFQPRDAPYEVWRLSRVESQGNRFAATVPLERRPVALAIGEGAVWVAHADAVSRVDPLTEEIVATIPVAPRLSGIAIGAGAVLATSTADRAVYVIDPRRNQVVDVVALERAPERLAFGDEALWFTSAFDRTLTRIRP